MYRYLVVFSTLFWLYGCQIREETLYPLHLTVEHRIHSSEVLSLAVFNHDLILGYDDEKKMLFVRGSAKEIDRSFRCDTVLSIRQWGDGLLIAAVKGDSVVFVALDLKGQLNRVGSIQGSSGSFIPTVLPGLLAWNGGTHVVTITPAGIEKRYPLLLPVLSEGNEQFLCDEKIVTLRQLSPDVMLWEGINIMSGQKLFSTVIPGNIHTTSLTCDKVVTLLSRPDGYVLEWRTVPMTSIGSGTELTLPLPSGFYEPQAVFLHHDTVIVLFSSGILLAAHENIVGIHRGPIDKVSSSFRIVSRHGDRIALHGQQHFLNIRLDTNRWWWVERSVPLLYRAVAIVIFAGSGIWIVRRLRRHRRLVNTLLERGTQGALMLLDKHACLRQLNTTARRLFGIDREIPLGRTLNEYPQFQAVPSLLLAVEQVLHQHSAVMNEMTLSQGKNTRAFLVSVEPLLSGVGRLEGILISMYDVTTQYEQWQRLNWAHLAHDMQTSLATIRLSAERLLALVPAELKDQTSRVFRQATVLLDRIRDILALGRSDSLDEGEYHVEHLFHEVVAEVQSDMTAHISFIVRPSPIILRLDKRRVIRALHNVLTNSIRAIGNDAGVIELWADVDPRKITICIRDSGCGMDAQTLEQLTRADFTTSRGSGYGFGMMIIRSMIEQHGGTVDIQSTPDHGTTVMFHLPRSRYVRHYS